MDIIKGNYAEAVVYTDDIEEYAKAQIQLICDNEICRMFIREKLDLLGLL